MKKVIAMLLLVLMLAMSCVLIGCIEPDDTDTDVNTNTDTNTSTDTSSDGGNEDINHSHDLPAPPAEDITSDYEMK